MNLKTYVSSFYHADVEKNILSVVLNLNMTGMITIIANHINYITNAMYV